MERFRFLGISRNFSASIGSFHHQALHDFGVGVFHAAEVAAEAILVELFVRLAVPQAAAITKNIVDMMGGTIEVQTEQGKGTEFIIRLPLRIQPENHRIEKIAELEGLKALVVDDDFNTCDSVTKMLVKVGMRSEWTLSGKEAVLRARQSVEMGDAFHAYIIDWRLPDMNGIEVTRQIRSLGDDTPIIILDRKSTRLNSSHT